MRRLLSLAAAVLLSMIGACASIGTGGGWTSLIEAGQGLENFVPIGDANWRAEGGALVADKGKGGFLVSRRSYRDFQIRAEFHAESDTNSGIFIRAQDPAKVTAASSYEVNIWDTRPEQKYGTGAIVDVAAVNPMPRAGGRWNTFEITARGSRLTVVLNGVTTVDVDDSKFAAGPFALQFANLANAAPGGAIKWRRVQIREL